MWNYPVWLSMSDTEIPWGLSCENKIEIKKIKQIGKWNNRGIKWIKRNK